VGGHTLKRGQFFYVREEFANEGEDHRNFILSGDAETAPSAEKQAEQLPTLHLRDFSCTTYDFSHGIFAFIWPNASPSAFLRDVQ
jgi:hypothetical protein